MGPVASDRPQNPLTPREPLGATHSTEGFSCGKPALDDWLKLRALKSEGRSARTFVVCASQAVVGHYCLAAGSVRLDELPRKLSGDMPASVPVILIGRLAVHAGWHGKGIGKHLLKDALARALQISQQLGCRAVLVHALDEEAAAFYAGFGFIAFPQGGRTLFLAIKPIAAAI